MIGSTVTHFRILERLGAGGMGVVYGAEDVRLGRRVALKFLSSVLLANADDLLRFRREAQLAASLAHPNICTVYEVDEHEGRPFIAMELLAGQTLADLIAAGPLPVDRALELGIDLAAGLEAAHTRGIVHRDLKPGNVMVTRDGVAKIMDFGIAVAQDLTRVTQPGVALGTVAYMAPEQARGEPADSRADVWSLGVILYEMLAGRLPFAGANATVMLYALLHEEAEPLSNLRVGLPSELERIVVKAMTRDPAGRHGDAGELARDLRESARRLARSGDGSAADDHRAGARGSRQAPAPRTDEQRLALAVLPFANMSGEPQDEFLCEGLAEEIINALTRLPGLRVIARTSSFAVARLGLDAHEAGARLKVDHILEGSVRRSGPRVRVAVQLVETADGAHLWSDRYDREMTDVLALEDEIAAAVVAKLRGSTAAVSPAGRPCQVDALAHQAYLEGRYHSARATPESLARAETCYERAVSLDPAFALAFDALAELHWLLGFFGQVPPRDTFAQSTWYALRALELDDSLADTHALLGMLRKELDYNWPEVAREMARALELCEESPVVRLRYAICGLMPHGRNDEALQHLEYALRSDPLSHFVRWWVACIALFARRPERTLAEGRFMIDLDPGHYLGHAALGLGLELSGRLDEAAIALDRADRLSGGLPLVRGFLLRVLGGAGDRARVRGMLAELERTATARYVSPSTVAMGYIGLGEWDAAFRWLDRAVEDRDPVAMPIRSYAFLDPVQDDPRYRALLRKMNLA